MNLLSDARANVPSSLLRDRFDYSPYVATDINCGELINRLAAGIRMSSRMLIESGDERRYPGDASQFLHDDSGSLDIETGAAGIMLMMSRAGMNVQEDVEWIKRKLDAGTSIGFTASCVGCQESQVHCHNLGIRGRRLRLCRLNCPLSTDMTFRFEPAFPGQFLRSASLKKTPKSHDYLASLNLRQNS